MILFNQASSQYAVTTGSWTPSATAATISFWWYYTQQNGVQNYHLYHDGGNYMRMNAAAIEVALLRQSGRDTYYSLPFATNTLYHVAVTATVGAKTEIDIWINGTRVVTANSGNSGTPTNATTAWGWDKGTSYFYGAVMDFRWYERVLTTREIPTIYAARGRDGILQGLAHRWPMTGGADGTTVTGTGVVRDWVGELHATPVNSPVWEADNPLAWRKIA